jgi:tRNA dimethylallyltransferase
VYRGLDVGSAKTRPEERGDIPHHLLDVVYPAEDFTAGAFAQLAKACLARISGLPILVGGTGFYLRSLLDGLSPAPVRNAELRERLSNSTALHRFLRRIDQAAAARIHANDRQKLIRAIELAIAVSSPAPREPLKGYRVLKLGVNPAREDLYGRLNRRSAAMFENGLLEETAALLAAGVPAEAKSLQSLGYKQAVGVLENRLTREQAVAELQMKTRHYAKRQMTWFRREADVQWLDGFGDDNSVADAAVSLVKAFHHHHF